MVVQLEPIIQRQLQAFGIVSSAKTIPSLKCSMPAQVMEKKWGFKQSNKKKIQPFSSTKATLSKYLKHLTPYWIKIIHKSWKNNNSCNNSQSRSHFWGIWKDPVEGSLNHAYIFLSNIQNNTQAKHKRSEFRCRVVKQQLSQNFLK